VIVDASALVAVMRDESDAAAFTDAMATASRLRISAVNFVEAAIVIDGAREPVASRRFDEFVKKMGIEVEAVTPDQAQIARQAYRDFGKGSGHPAKLNLGDCFAYALAKTTGEALLFKGTDFIHIDVKRALRPPGTLQEPPSPIYGELWD